MAWGSGNPAAGNVGHKRCKYCNVDNWEHSSPDCPGKGPPIIEADVVSAYPSRLKFFRQNEREQMEDYVALWCTPGAHSFSATDPDKEIFTRTRKSGAIDPYGVMVTKTEQFAVCGEHSNFSGSPTKTVGEIKETEAD